MKSIIIEDELSSRELLKKFLDKYTTDVSVVGEADSIASGIELINSTKPDLIFLDVELKDGNGFEILNKIKSSSGLIIFITGYKHYAIKAIEHFAFAYLLKPLLITELKEVVGRAKDRLEEMSLLKSLKSKSPEIDEQKIIVRNSQGIQVIDTSEIVFLRADGNITEINLINSKRIHCHRNLKQYEDELQNGFFRVHKSYIVNLHRVSELRGGRTGEISMDTGISVPLASRRKSMFLEVLAGISS